MNVFSERKAKPNNGIHNFELVGYLAKRKGMEKANACSEVERE